MNTCRHEDCQKSIKVKGFCDNHYRQSRYNNEPDFLERKRTYGRRYNRVLKKKVIDKYGSVCKCCEESKIEFLSIDHVEGNGNSHRRELGKEVIYRWLELNNYPEGYRVLCMNCNFSLGAYGYCPHKTCTDFTAGELFKSYEDKVGTL